MRTNFRNLIAVCLILSAGAAFGDSKTNPEVKYRQDVMEAMSKHFSALAAVFTGKVKRPDQLEVHAKALADTAALAPTLFPAGSEGGNALPLIWEEPEQVTEAAQRTVDSTRSLATAAAAGDRAELAKAFKAAGDGCKGCHERYKAEDS